MSPFVRVFPGCLSEALCRQVCDRFDADPRVVEGHALGVPAAKRCRELVITTLPEWEALRGELRRVVHESASRYREEVPNFKLIHRRARDTGYQIQRYEPNGSDGFAWHADANSRETCARFLAMILYLNTVDEGGETQLAAQQLEVKPVAGTVLWFPPGFEYMHRGLTPVSGPKYIMTTFLAYP